MDLNPVFVVGCPRSGTTLLGVMLDRHGAIAVPPETAFYDEVAPILAGAGRHGLHDLLGCWRRLSELGLTADEVLETCGPEPARADLLAALLCLYATKRGKALCGEKTPQHLQHVSTILSDFPEARVLCLMRDGRDVVLSLAAMPWWAGGLEGAAAMWIRAEAKAAAFEAAYPSHFACVRYEDLVGEPERTLSSVMTFLGLAFEAAQLDPAVASGVVLERSLAWKGEALARPDPNGVGRRQRSASRAEREAVERMLGEALRRRRYGAMSGFDPQPGSGRLA